jgi:hypothetical protein
MDGDQRPRRLELCIPSLELEDYLVQRVDRPLNLRGNSRSRFHPQRPKPPVSHQPERLQSGRIAESAADSPLSWHRVTPFICAGRCIGIRNGLCRGTSGWRSALDTAVPISYRDLALAVADAGAEATNRATPHEHTSDFTLMGDSPAMAVWKPTGMRTLGSVRWGSGRLYDAECKVRDSGALDHTSSLQLDRPAA